MNGSGPLFTELFLLQATAFDGTIDELSMWRRALSADEVYHSRWKRFTAADDGLLAYWDFDEGSGRVAHDAGPFALHAEFGSGSEPTWITSVSKPLNDVSDIEK